MIGLNCSGLVTLSKHKLKGQRYVKLDLGDGTKAPLLDLYITHFSNKKVLYTDITIKASLIFRRCLITLHDYSTALRKALVCL